MAPSLWRRPGTKTFQLVHRSQRDPLINDPNASDRVLKQVDRSQRTQGKQSAVPDESAPADDALPAGEDGDAGDAAAYGVFFDDTEYDYLQHLRSVGAAQDAYLVEAPTAKNNKGKGKGKRADDFVLDERPPRSAPAFEMPEDALPSHPLDETSYTDLISAKAPIAGLQPDLDPSIREVLEALDDEAYAVDDGEGTDEEDAFWEGVVTGGEVKRKEEQYWSEEDEVSDAAKGVGKLHLAGGEEDGAGGEWAAVKRFKAAQKAEGPSDDEDEDEDDFASEGGDTIAELMASSARRPARGGRAAASALGSSFSMSSSAMFRNEGLRTLDDRFDQIEKLYDESDDDSWGGGSDDDDDGEFHGPQRADLDAILDDFLSRYEVIGGKMKPVLDPLDPATAAAFADDPVAANASKLDRIRQSLAQLDLGDEEAGEDPEVTARRREKERILKIVERQQREESSRKKKDRLPMVEILEDRRKDRWDCETVLSTYSNVSNHPRLLRIRDSNRHGPKPAQIKLDPKTGFPMVDGQMVVPSRGKGKKQEDMDVVMEDEEEDDDDDEEDYAHRETIKRPRAETAAEKKARKAAVKQERQARRVEKKETKDAFGNEMKRQKKAQGRKVADGGAADIRPGVEGVRRLA
ncbi:SPOSA6832_04766, partial [Sporobolomyces salmonicolor]